MHFLLNAEEIPQIQQYLLDKKWIAPDEEIISARKPGEGNMNYTLRIRTNFRTFILKQSRDYVEKYPQIPAPRERAVIEGHFYQLIQEDPKMRNFTPEVSGIDAVNSIIQLEDFGQSEDFSFLYKADQELKEDQIDEIVDFISSLHNAFNQDTTTPNIANKAMRELNAEHIFNYPFLAENGFSLDDVTPGLQAVAMRYKTDQAFTTRIKDLSQHYLTDGAYLLHGDYYPGSWLQTIHGVRIIDPEFCFFGPAEFDISVMIAHMKMARQPEEVSQRMLARYQEPPKFYTSLMEQLTGVEIMRRLIGLAQLPLSLTLEEKEALLEEAYHLIMG
ncbi:MAG: phosphotransferase [Bacteroidota bacterium]